MGCCTACACRTRPTGISETEHRKLAVAKMEKKPSRTYGMNISIAEGMFGVSGWKYLALEARFSLLAGWFSVPGGLSGR